MATFAQVCDKLRVITDLIEKLNDVANTDATNIIGLGEDAQALGVVSDYLFPQYINKFTANRSAFNKMFVDALGYQSTILAMFAEVIDSKNVGTLLIRDIQKYMDDNAITIKERNFTRGATTYVDSNAGTIVVHTTDWIGEDIETGKTAGNWTLTCKQDQHDASSLFAGGAFRLAPDTLSVTGDELTTSFTNTYDFKAINGSNNKQENLVFDSFNSWSATKGFTNWEVTTDWANTGQSSTIFLHENINSRTTALPNGLAYSGYLSDDDIITKYLNNLSFSRYTPYLVSLAYKHEDALADGRLTLSLGSQSVQSPADGLTGALTGTATFSGVSDQLIGVGTKFLSELKPGDLVWNSSDDAIAQAYTVVSVQDNTNATMDAVYGGTAAGGRALSAMHTGWHHITLVTYLDDFWEDNLYASIEKTGHGAGNIYFDDFIIKPMRFFADFGRYIEFIADSVDVEKGQTWTWADTVIESVIQRWFTRQYGLSLPNAAVPTIAD